MSRVRSGGPGFQFSKSAVRETNVSRHNGGPIERPLKYDSDVGGVSGGPSIAKCWRGLGGPTIQKCCNVRGVSGGPSIP